jgi:hypothetical protein
MGSEPKPGAEPIAVFCPLTSLEPCPCLAPGRLAPGACASAPAYCLDVSSNATGIPTISYFTRVNGASFAR